MIMSLTKPFDQPLTPDFSRVHDPYCNCFDCAFTPVDGVISHADAKNPIEVQVGDIIKLKQDYDLGVIGKAPTDPGGTVHKVKDTVLVNQPVTKVTPNALYLGDKYYIRKDANYIVVDSTKGIVRQTQIVTSNQGATLAKPAKDAVTAVKDTVNNIIDKGETFFSGLGTTLKWVLIAVIVLGVVYLVFQFKNVSK